MPEQAVNAGLTIAQLGAGFTVDPVNKKVHVKSQVSADAGNKIIAGSDGGAFVADTPVWLTQTDGTPATADTDAIQHSGNVAMLQNMAVRSGGDMATAAALDATNKSLIRLTSSGTIAGIAGGEDGKFLTLMNTSAGEVTLENASSSAAAGTKIIIADSYNFIVAPGGTVLLQYDATSLGWRCVSHTILGFAPEFMSAINNLAQAGLVANSNINFGLVAKQSGSSITHPDASSFLLKAGRTYRLVAKVGVATIGPGGWFYFQWHNGSAFVGTSGQMEQNATRPTTGLCDAVVTPAVDTTYRVRVVESSGSQSVDANACSAWAEVIEGLAPASNIKLLSRVFTGSAPSPIAVPPVGDPIEGETYIQTDTGLEDGFVISEWRYTGTAWRRVNYIDYPAMSAPTLMNRTYYPLRAAYVPYMTAAQTAAQIAAHGFTAVGGATISNYGMYSSYNIIQARATRQSAANVTDIPTSYIRHELPITVGVDNTYHMSTLTNRANFTALTVWVCDPVTGVPVKRVGANSQASQGADNHQHINIAPDNGHPQISSYYEFSSFAIPKALIAAYKTASNTIKLALHTNTDSSETDLWYIGGWGMTSNPYGLVTQPIIVNHWQMDGVKASNVDWQGDIAGCAACSVPTNGTKRVRIPVLDAAKDLVITVIGRSSEFPDSFFGDYTLVHASGNVQLGRLPVTGETPYGTATNNNLQSRKGFSIPASTLAAKTITPLNSGVSYIEIDIKNLSYHWLLSIHGFAVEYLNP